MPDIIVCEQQYAEDKHKQGPTTDSATARKNNIKTLAKSIPRSTYSRSKKYDTATTISDTPSLSISAMT